MASQAAAQIHAYCPVIHACFYMKPAVICFSLLLTPWVSDPYLWPVCPDQNKEAKEHKHRHKNPQTYIGYAHKQHTWPNMILPGLALTTSCKEAAFTLSTTSLLEMLVMGSPNHSGPFATFLKAYAHTQVMLSRVSQIALAALGWQGGGEGG